MNSSSDSQVRTNRETGAPGPRTRTLPFKSIAGIALSLILLGWILHKADLSQVLAALRSISPWPVAATILIGCLSIPVRVMQWRWLLGNPGQASFFGTLRALCLGYLGNCLLPMRGGELLRTYVLSRQTAIPIPRVLASVVLSRVQDLLPICLITAAVFAAIPLGGGITLDANGLFGSDITIPEPQLRGAFLVFCLVVLGIACGLIAFYWIHERVGEGILRVSRGFSPALAAKLERLLGQITEALRVLGTPKLFWGSQVLAFLCWGIFLVAPIPLLMGFGLGLGSAALTALAITGLSTFAHLLPSAPGAVGTFHALCLVGLHLCNPAMDRDTAIAYTLIAHLISTASPALPGLLFLPQAWGDVRAIRSEEDSTASQCACTASQECDSK